MDLEEYYCFHSLQAHHLYDSLRFYPGLQAADSLEQIHKTRLDSIEEEDPYSMLLDEYHYLWGLYPFGDSMLARLTRKFQWLRFKQDDAQFKEITAEPCMDSEDYFLRDIYGVRDITIEQRIKLKFHLLHQVMSSMQKHRGYAVQLLISINLPPLLLCLISICSVFFHELISASVRSKTIHSESERFHAH
jgi:hypothetical protein